MDELTVLQKKYEYAMQTLMQSSDVIYTLKAQLDIAQAKLAELETKEDKKDD